MCTGIKASGNSGNRSFPLTTGGGVRSGGARRLRPRGARPCAEVARSWRRDGEGGWRGRPHLPPACARASPLPLWARKEKHSALGGGGFFFTTPWPRPPACWPTRARTHTRPGRMECAVVLATTGELVLANAHLHPVPGSLRVALPADATRPTREAVAGRLVRLEGGADEQRTAGRWIFLATGEAVPVEDPFRLTGRGFVCDVYPVRGDEAQCVPHTVACLSDAVEGLGAEVVRLLSVDGWSQEHPPRVVRVTDMVYELAWHRARQARPGSPHSQGVPVARQRRPPPLVAAAPAPAGPRRRDGRPRQGGGRTSTTASEPSPARRATGHCSGPGSRRRTRPSTWTLAACATPSASSGSLTSPRSGTWTTRSWGVRSSSGGTCARRT